MVWYYTLFIVLDEVSHKPISL